MSTPHESPSPTPPATTDQSKAGDPTLKWSCSACRQSKRRCDKLYPECTLCTQQKLKDRIKAASSASKFAVNPPSTETTKKDHQSVERLPFPSGNTSFIAERFLDPDVFSRAHLTVINVEVPVTNDIAQLVGSVMDIQATSAQFFKSVHTWMPIISKPHFCANLLNRLTYQRAELFLLVLSMKLCCARQKTWNTPLYETVKLLYFKIETSGALSVLVLQAAILIALYELGHAVYPAAFLSVGSCARYLNLSDPKRHLITPDADIESYLPVDDEAWETGVPDSHHIYTLATANSYHLGLFARFAQAAHLLSKVLHQVAEQSNETAQLRRTIFALVNVSKIEASMRRGVLLLDASSMDKDTDHSATRLSPESAHISQVTLDMALSFVQGDAEEICAIVSPFLIHLLYRVASIHLRIAHESPTTAALEKVELLKKAMRIVGSRWLCASTYLSLLEKQDILLVMQ
ncbi:hypothetical protein MKX07_004487 [Trichoderma sp. CBMAI-0711]|nr:hypothetical protein MKX07_004487 [Trichoderma sp. CBMAI-0711]